MNARMPVLAVKALNGSLSELGGTLDSPGPRIINLTDTISRTSQRRGTEVLSSAFFSKQSRLFIQILWTTAGFLIFFTYTLTGLLWFISFGRPKKKYICGCSQTLEHVAFAKVCGGS
jgi:hypothetical protein